jgi:anaerobic magnesium-protoporphyrin IX monomethyl ester cyclase
LILLMTTAPPLKGAWYLGKRLPPLGLAYVAGALEKAGFQVEILDNYMLKKPTDQVKILVQKLHPEIVGITCGSATYTRCVETAQAIKEVLSSCRVVVGGWHPSYVPESMLQHPEIDYVVMGEGERAMTDLATGITKGEDEKTLASIPGVACKLKGEVIKNAPTFIGNLDEVPFPARHLLPMQLYDRTIEFLKVKPVDIMSIARGCQFNCAFCETKKLWGNSCRGFSPGRVVEEIQYLIQNYGTKGVYFINDNFTIRKKHVEDICELIGKNKLDVEWVCDTRANLVSRDLLRKMKSAGCRTIWFGVESGSPRILEKLNKNVTLEQTERAFRLCREEGIQIACSFIMGIPGETVRDMEASFRFAKKLDPDWCRFNIYIALPESSLYQEVLQSNRYDRLDEFLITAKTDDFDLQSLMKIQRRFHRGFNRSPKRIIRKIRREGLSSFLRQSFKLLWRTSPMETESV